VIEREIKREKGSEIARDRESKKYFKRKREKETEIEKDRKTERSI
jgi:hypothetical protein